MRLNPSSDGWLGEATVTHETDNRFDPNAVAVIMLGVVVGYLPKEFAPIVSQLLGNTTFTVPALVVGGFQTGKTQGLFGVRLFLGWTQP